MNNSYNNICLRMSPSALYFELFASPEAMAYAYNEFNV